MIGKTERFGGNICLMQSNSSDVPKIAGTMSGVN
jgi:hypothetical protein